MAVLLTDRRLSPELSEWAASRIAHVGAAGFGPCWAIGVALHGELAAVVVWHDFQPAHGTIQLSMASVDPRWINHAVVGRILALAFDQNWGRDGVQIRKVWVVIPSTAQRTIKLNAALGLRPEGTLRHHFYPNVHAVVCGIMANEYRAKYVRRAELTQKAA